MPSPIANINEGVRPLITSEDESSYSIPWMRNHYGDSPALIDLADGDADAIGSYGEPPSEPFDVRIPGWMLQAKCSTATEDFTCHANPAAKKRICAVCPVADQCRMWAVNWGIGYGIFGGLTPRERRRIAPTPTRWSMGYVYVAIGDSVGVKVGYSEVPTRRADEIQSSTGDKTIRLLGYVSATQTYEKHLLSLLRPWRVKGEYFRNCPEVRSRVAHIEWGTSTECSARRMPGARQEVAA